MKHSLFLLTCWLTLLPAFTRAQTQVREVAYIEPQAELSQRVYSYWTVFTHPRYGYELPVPPGVRSVGVPEAAAQTKFVSPDRAFVMSAWGGTIAQPPAAVLNDQWRRALTRPERMVTYHYKTPAWYVVSGTDTAGMEFYEKFMVRGHQVAACVLTYPKTRLRDFAPWVEGVEDAFGVTFTPDEPPALAPARLVVIDDGTVETLTAYDTRARGDSTLAPAFGTTVSTATLSPPRTPGLPTIRGAGAPAKRPAPPTNSDRVDFAPPKLEGPVPTDSPESPAKKEPETARPPSVQIPVAEKASGKPGFVYSPFQPDKKLVDVEGLASGTKAKCPYTDKVFRIP